MKKYFLLVSVLMFLTGFPACAHAADYDQPGTARGAATDWTQLPRSIVKRGRRVVVVEGTAPQTRVSCRVRQLRPDALVCSEDHHRETIIPAQNIVALLNPYDRNDDLILRIWAGAGFALITAGFFAGPAAPALWVVGGLALLTFPAAAMGADNSGDDGEVIYYAPHCAQTVPAG